MEQAPRQLKLGETYRHENGVLVSARRQNPLKPVTPGETARHEAAHIVAAGRILWATIIPNASEGYLGATMPLFMTAASAMAAHALGMSGTSWDVYLTEHILHENPSGGAADAISTLSGQMDLLEAVAEELELKGTIGQSDVEVAQDKTNKRRHGIWMTDIYVWKPDGTTEKHTAESTNNVVMVANEWVVFESGKEKIDDKKDTKPDKEKEAA